MNFAEYKNKLSDYEEVLSVIGEYVSGLKSGNIDQVQRAFHKDAIMYGYDRDDLMCGSIDNLYKWLEKGKADTNNKGGELRTHIDVLDITPTTAVARVTLEYDFAGTDPVRTQYTTDYHSLIKVDGKWVVIAKLFHWYNY